jgi:hypothetical protein
VKKVLLACGIASSVLYIAMNAFIPMLYEGYSVASQTVSELSAISAPTRPLWVWLGTVYSMLLAAFGWGIRMSAAGNRRLRIVGFLMIADAVFGLFWPPMHPRGAAFTMTDAMHIAWSAVTVLLMMLAIAFGAAAFGRRFRVYSIATMVTLILFGVLTGLDGPRIAANLPTPWIGVWERIGIAAFMVWILVLAIELLRGARPRLISV